MIDESLLKNTIDPDTDSDRWDRFEAVSGRLSKEMEDSLPDDVNIDKLRTRLSDLFAIKFANNYTLLERECNIKKNTFQKVLKYQNGRNITWTLLAKFCTGARLSVAEASELFMLIGEDLHSANRKDFLLVNILNTGQDINALDNDLMKYCKSFHESILNYDD